MSISSGFLPRCQGRSYIYTYIYILYICPTYQHAKTINDTIGMFKANQKLREKIADGLKSHNPKTPTLKLPPKVHKENHPGRPIVSSINSYSTKISEYVDHHLQPYTKDIKSYIKDTKDFLNHLDKVPTNISENSYLATLDVKSLYLYTQ